MVCGASQRVAPRPIGVQLPKPRVGNERDFMGQQPLSALLQGTTAHRAGAVGLVDDELALRRRSCKTPGHLESGQIVHQERTESQAGS